MCVCVCVCVCVCGLLTDTLTIGAKGPEPLLILSSQVSLLTPSLIILLYRASREISLFREGQVHSEGGIIDQL